MDPPSGRRRIGVDDPSLVARAATGDRDAFGAIVGAHLDGLFAIAFRILRAVDPAEDAVQETLITAWRELPRLREPDRLVPWLRRILVRCCTAELGRRRRVLPLAALGDADLARSGTSEEARADDRDQVERAFLRLTVDQRAVLVLHHWLGLSPAEVATTLDIPPGTARARLHRAHAAVRAAIAADARPVPQPQGGHR
jgi:RNA polymerase sigma-70 factor, ECF subfamily